MDTKSSTTSAPKPFTIFGIEFAPLIIPIERRIQTLILVYTVLGLAFGILGILLLIYLVLWTKYWWIGILYGVWVYIDRETPCKGGRPIRSTRNSPAWRHYVNYFPITLERTEELNPEKNYIFGYHPHGFMATGAFANFMSDATGFKDLFPGINPWLVTLKVNFWMPFYRELVMMRGLVDSSRESINWLLQKCGKGNAVVIVVGGAQESLDAVPDTMRLTLKSRKGFVKIAIQNGTHLVPVISFGENELYSQADHSKDSKVRKVQEKVKSLLTFTFPLIYGRGIFQYSFGFLPYRTPIHTIVGKAIQTIQNPNPTKEEVDAVHADYVNGLLELFHRHKGKYARNPQLEIELR